MRIVSIGCGIFIWLLLAGCAQHREVNQLISDSNTARYGAFTSGMNSANTEGARIAIAMAFAANMGILNYYREDSYIDWLRAADGILNPWAMLWLGNDNGDSDSQAMTAGRDIYFHSSNQHDAWSSATQDLFTVGDGSYIVSPDVVEGDNNEYP